MEYIRFILLGRMQKYFGDFFTFLKRIAILYVIYMVIRILFYAFNYDLFGPLLLRESASLLNGAIVFDSISILYINIPFIALSLLPLKIRSKTAYQKILLYIFVVINALGLALNIADIFYYPYKSGRISLDDFNLMTGGNGGLLILQFIKNFWYGFLFWGLSVYTLWYFFKKIKYKPSYIGNNVIYTLSQSAIFIVSIFITIVMIRGGSVSPAIFPINVNDATLYASPQKSALVLSNPFVFIRTAKQNISYTEYFTPQQLDNIFISEHESIKEDSLPTIYLKNPNIVLIILESFGSAHIKSLSTQFPKEATSYTPFLDSLINVGYSFSNAYTNCIRSIDALPALWGSVPSFKNQFLSIPQSMSLRESLPGILNGMGYTSAFMHGAERKSMSFVAFGKSMGVRYFYSLEEYEAENGKNDFDGQWGIWDHKFLPYAAKKLSGLPTPFFATIFTLSSHQPFLLPSGFEHRYNKGTMDIHKTLGYTDEALRGFFNLVSREEWYKNSLFIIVADHGSGADNDIYRNTPYSNSIPFIIYSPQGLLKGTSSQPAQQIDLKPTILGLLRYDKPFFGYGTDLFAKNKKRYAITYSNGVFHTVTDSLVYTFNEKNFIEVYNYLKDPLRKNNLVNSHMQNDSTAKWTKAFIQSYYSRLKNSNLGNNIK